MTINVGYPSGIEIRGRPLRERQPYSNDKEYSSTENTKSIGPDVRHELEVGFDDVLISYQLKLEKVRAKLANLNHCAVPFLSRAAANLCLCYYQYHQ